MSRRPEKLGSAMAGALKGLKLDARMREGRAMALWPDIVGDVTAQRTKPLHVNRGTMVVLVASSAWANQLNLLKPKILQALAERCGPGVIKDIRWRSGEQEPEPGEHIEVTFSRLQKKANVEEPPLPAEETQAIEAMLRPITNPEVAKAVERTLVSQARRRARLRQIGWVACKRCGVLHDQADRPFLRAPRQEVLGEPEGTPKPPPDRLEGMRLCPVCRMELSKLLDP